MTPRPARAGDAGAIAAIANHYIRDTTVTFTTVEKSEPGIAADIAARQSGGQCFIVLDGTDGLAGFASSFPFRAGPGYARTLEHTVLLAPGSAGQGRGRCLLEAVERHARAARVDSLIAGISAENPAAIGFHAAMGFAPAGRIARAGRKFGRCIDLVLMQKLLSEAPGNR